MLRSFHWVLACAIFALWAVDSKAQSPTPEPPGTIVNGTGDSSGKIKSWISRHGNTATALTLYSLGDEKIYGTLRRFKINGEGSPSLLTDPIVVDPDDSGPLPPKSVEVVSVRLEPVSTATLYSGWEIVYDNRTGFPTIDGAPANLVIGWVSFQPGKEDRKGSVVMVRTKKGTVVSSVDPCSGPPADDVGEEELISGSLTYANTPVSPLPPYNPQTSGPED